jgi:hypothetical protein
MLEGIFSALYGIKNVLIYFLYLSPLIIVLVIALIHFRNKKMYQYPVRILRQRENGKYKEINRKGGFINRKGGTPFFRIKMGFWWWKFKDLSETPKLSYMDEDNRVYYKQIDIDTYIQMKREVLEDAGGEKVMGSDGKEHIMPTIKLLPVETDVKYGTILSLARIREVLSPKDKWKTIASIGGMVLIFALAIIGWALMMNSKCPTVG